ncbi:DUF2277 domain-containing protein [Nocardiopsis sp. RSe5-2]|uniref:DUF2277 domain-containing protein n=1 Tax=Nocardiopsis endophytica TaxID=3018445 RepID=A0ABT4UBM6_9ACTN|nr:DUF2277 domain-containing protein [Nocardiopsis endophytica]MDA2813717.1 DUF2277 domain-containing protein [Nocardiopsis endophytica]
MCRNIRRLHNMEPPVTDEEVRAAALQYVRKVSGATAPSAKNREAFDRAVEAVAAATAELMDGLTTSAPPRSREEEARRRKERYQRRFEAVTE